MNQTRSAPRPASRSASSGSSGPALAVTVTRLVAAAPDDVYAVVSDIPRMGELSPETVAADWTNGSAGPEVGATFRGRNRIGLLRWSTSPVVTEAEPGRRFAFDVPAPSATSWVFEMAPAPGGCRVTESMRRNTPQPLPIRLLQRAVGVRDRAAHLRGGMTVTLDRLADAAESLASNRS